MRQKGSKADITLRTCPFATTALADPETVCELHLGIAYGIADNLDGLVIDELVPKDPRRANCRLRCHVESGSARRERMPDGQRRPTLLATASSTMRAVTPISRSAACFVGWRAGSGRPGRASTPEVVRVDRKGPLAVAMPDPISYFSSTS